VICFAEAAICCARQPFGAATRSSSAHAGHLARRTHHLPRGAGDLLRAPRRGEMPSAPRRRTRRVALCRALDVATQAQVARHDCAVDETSCSLPPTPTRHPLRRSRIRVFATRPSTR
jgi:hypothetical protein